MCLKYSDYDFLAVSFQVNFLATRNLYLSCQILKTDSDNLLVFLTLKTSHKKSLKTDNRFAIYSNVFVFSMFWIKEIVLAPLEQFWIMHQRLYGRVSLIVSPYMIMVLISGRGHKNQQNAPPPIFPAFFTTEFSHFLSQILRFFHCRLLFFFLPNFLPAVVIAFRIYSMSTSFQ